MAVRISQGQPSRAKGYVEMAGYDKEFDAPMWGTLWQAFFATIFIELQSAL